MNISKSQLRTVIMLLSILIQGCRDSSYLDIEENLKKTLQYYKKSTKLDRKVYLVTGLDGCGACLEYTTTFIEKNIQNKDFMFIVSGHSKVKLINKFSYQIRVNQNFIQDTFSVALHQQLANEHPIIYFCKDGHIVDFKEVTFMNADSVFKNTLVFDK